MRSPRGPPRSNGSRGDSTARRRSCARASSCFGWLLRDPHVPDPEATDEGVHDSSVTRDVRLHSTRETPAGVPAAARYPPPGAVDIAAIGKEGKSSGWISEIELRSGGLTRSGEPQ